MDKKQKKKLKRAVKKKKEKANAQEAQSKLKKQLNMFDKMPSVCSSCEKSFPKTQAAHSTWRVVVKNKKVWLFCPECQRKAKEMLGKNNEV